MTERPPFLTGSQRYGIPTDKSDIDIVVEITEDLARLLFEFSDKGKAISPNAIGWSLRFGKLNLICCNDTRYDAWKAATTECYLEKPTTRERAKEIFATFIKDTK